MMAEEDETVERVARAWYAAIPDAWHEMKWEGLTDLAREDFRKCARAAIAAMPSPSGWMMIDDEAKRSSGVLLIARYPTVAGTWSDPIWGWWCGLGEHDADGEWARWHHEFAPTHYRIITPPQD